MAGGMGVRSTPWWDPPILVRWVGAAPLINNDADDRAVMIIILDDEKNYVEKLVINVGFGSLAGQTSSCGSFVLVYPSSSR